MDNFHTGLKLVADLNAWNTFACGTIRSNRGKFPNDFQSKKLEKGQSMYIINDDMVAVHWKDKRDVFLLSSFHENSETIIHRYSEDISKPDMIIAYNNSMVAVDRCDQLMSYYSLDRKSRKWWVRVFFRLMEMSIVNAYSLFLMKHPEFKKKKSAHKVFREALTHQLVQPLLDHYTETSENSQGPSGGSKSGINPSKVRVTDNVRLVGKHYATKKYGIPDSHLYGINLI